MVNPLSTHLCKIKYKILISIFVTIACFASATHAAQLTNTASAQRSPLIAEVLMRIQLDYVDLDKLDPPQMLASALTEMSLKIPEIQSHYDFETAPHQLSLTVETHSSNIDLPRLSELDELNEVLQKIVQFVGNHWSSSSQINQIEISLVEGMLTELDPHSLLLPKHIYNEFKIGTRGHFNGVGISIGFRQNKLTVLSIVDNSPAEKAGILPKDQIVKIGYESTSNITALETINKLRGEKGSKLILSIIREGYEEAKKFELIREVIKINSVESLDLEGKHGKIRYLKIKNFQESTEQDLVKELQEMDGAAFRGTASRGAASRQIRGLILDLRDNPGGLLDQAVKVSDLFLSEKQTIVSTVGSQKQTKLFKSHWGLGRSTLNDVPLIILVNRSSASASEIVAAALKNNKRALLIGEQTFGKGSVQVLSELQDQSALKLTIAKYLTPGNKSIQSIGVTPDIVLYPVTITNEKIHILKPSVTLKSNPPLALLPYPLASDEESHLEEEIQNGGSPLSLKSQLEKDFLVTYAKIIFNEMWSDTPGIRYSAEQPPDRQTATSQALLDTAVNVHKRLIVEHERVISQKLEKQGVNWQVIETMDDAQFTVDLETEVKLKGQENWQKTLIVLPPEAMLRFKVSVTNTGKNPISRLFMVTQSRKRFFNRWELPIGYLESSNTITKYTIPVVIPKRGINIIDAINFQFYDYRMKQWHSQKKLVASEGQERAQFQFHIQVWDDGTHGSSGNGDHLLQPNETVALQLIVKNISNKRSHNAIALIKKKKVVKIDFIKDKIDLGPLETGEEKEGVLLIKVNEDAIVEDLGFFIEIHDGTIMGSGPARLPFTEKTNLTYYFSASSNIHKKLFQAPKIDYEIFDFMERPSTLAKDSFGSISENNQFQLGTASSNKLVLIGKAQDDQQLKDVFIYLNKKKIFYQSNFGLNKTDLHFETSFNLSEGFNQIFVFARDQHNILSSKELQIWRKEI